MGTTYNFGIGMFSKRVWIVLESDIYKLGPIMVRAFVRYA